MICRGHPGEASNVGEKSLGAGGPVGSEQDPARQAHDEAIRERLRRHYPAVLDELLGRPKYSKSISILKVAGGYCVPEFERETLEKRNLQRAHDWDGICHRYPDQLRFGSAPYGST
jgi:hypothetical protein